MAGLLSSPPQNDDSVAGRISAMVDRLWSTGRGPGLTVAVEASLVVALAWVAAQFIWIMATPVAAPQLETVTVQTQSSQDRPQDFSAVRNFPYFYPVGSEARRNASPLQNTRVVAPVAEKSAAPESDLSLELFGLRAEQGDATQGSAIIQSTDNRQGAFVTGDEIQPGVTLEAVYSDRIEILREGVLESVFLSPDRIQRQRPLPPQSSGQTQTSAGSAEQSPAQPQNQGAPSSVSLSDLSSVTPAEALSQFQLRPRMEGSRINGFVVQALGSDPRLGVLDVKPGDVIMEVNGTRLTSFERVSELPEELRGATELRIGLLRDGKREERRIEVTP